MHNNYAGQGEVLASRNDGRPQSNVESTVKEILHHLDPMSDEDRAEWCMKPYFFI